MHADQVIRAGAAALGTTLALAMTQVATAAAPHAGTAAASPKVSVTIIGRTKTLLKAETVQTRSGSITRGGAPAGWAGGGVGCGGVAARG